MPLRSLFKRKKPAEPAPREYQIGKYRLLMDAGHQLPRLQATHPLYDRFLPIFCHDFNGTIIDIGANIGDTSIAVFARNENSVVVGVEADPHFYEACMANIQLNGLRSRFVGINKFISTKTGHFKIEKNATQSTGSISIDQGPGPSNTVSYAELMAAIPPQNTNVELLKIDTDGFDWDVIASFYDYAKTGSAVPSFVFFEAQPYLNNEINQSSNRQEMTAQYSQALHRLKDCGYDSFCLFDNFGTHIAITPEVDNVIQLLEYINRSQVCNLLPTVYYLDILAFHSQNVADVRRKLDLHYRRAS